MCLEYVLKYACIRIKYVVSFCVCVLHLRTCEGVANLPFPTFLPDTVVWDILYCVRYIRDHGFLLMLSSL